MKHLFKYIYIYINLQHRPQTKEELFNLRHSSLRNIIERMFGIIKKRFKVLRNGFPGAYEDQRLLVLALLALNNYITYYDHDDFLLKDSFNEEIGSYSQQSSWQETAINSDNEDSKSWRDSIAEKMWIDYCNNSDCHLPVL